MDVVVELVVVEVVGESVVVEVAVVVVVVVVAAGVALSVQPAASAAKPRVITKLPATIDLGRCMNLLATGTAPSGAIRDGPSGAMSHSSMTADRVR
ncbi:MAG: hypothetical protein ABSG36_15290 [Acidimicrobiales bacterium]